VSVISKSARGRRPASAAVLPALMHRRWTVAAEAVLLPLGSVVSLAVAELLIVAPLAVSPLTLTTIWKAPFLRPSLDSGKDDVARAAHCGRRGRPP
jgi:hypothetical protein